MKDGELMARIQTNFNALVSAGIITDEDLLNRALCSQRGLGNFMIHMIRIHLDCEGKLIISDTAKQLAADLFELNSRLY